MSKAFKAKTVLNKKYAMTLIEKNFKLLDVQNSIKMPGEIAFIFENSEEIEREFSILVNENKHMSGMHGLDLSDIKVLLKSLQGYELDDNERFRVMNKIQYIDDLICGYTAPANYDEVVTEEAELNLDGLKHLNCGK
ncbi:MAG: hypothetical protein PHF63_06910 [Herbinix sp.]|nr:hypothetical protein [Herbinix sp.]